MWYSFIGQNILMWQSEVTFNGHASKIDGRVADANRGKL